MSGSHANGFGPMFAITNSYGLAPLRFARSWIVVVLVALVSLGACDRGDLGDAPIARCVPEGACDDAMFQGGIKASLGDAARGASLFAGNCSRCHGAAGVGVADALAIDMTSPAWQAGLRDAALVRAIRSGRGMRMPAFSFADQELRDLLAHIRKLEVRKAPAGGPMGGY